VLVMPRAGNLRPEDLSGGAVTVSNVGMHGASWLVPIVNPGQSSIIGVGAAKPQFRPDHSGSPTLRQLVSLVLSGDHRVLDGVKGAQFLNAIVCLLEHPSELMS
jgi:pyruvate dehydrogenase E2 component (dihydrolipoamide acetyltransferase)